MRSTPGHRGNRFGAPRALEDEHRIDQVVGRQCVLTHQAPGKSSRRMRRIRVPGNTPFVIIGLAFEIFFGLLEL
jgi:hypothetical protein